MPALVTLFESAPSLEAPTPIKFALDLCDADVTEVSLVENQQWPSFTSHLAEETSPYTARSTFHPFLVFCSDLKHKRANRRGSPVLHASMKP